MKIKYSKKSLKFLAKQEKATVAEQNLALEFMKRIVLAWDPDFTKLTPAEAAGLKEAENDEYIDESDIDWGNLEKYAE